MSFFYDLIQYPFLQYAVIAGILSSIPSGVIGSYITVKRISYIAGAIAHCVFGGMGIAKFLNVVYGLKFITPFHGAISAALIAALIIGIVTLYGKQREDTVLSAIWAIGFAIGILFIYATPGYNEDIMSYLFGNILLVKIEDLILLGILDLLIILFISLFYNKILSLSFDSEYAKLKGIRVNLYSILFLILIALTIVFLIQIVGIVMVIALLSLPAAISANFSKKFWQMILFASIINLICMLSGIFVSYNYNLPPGATIIIFTAILYILSLTISKVLKIFIVKRTIS